MKRLQHFIPVLLAVLFFVQTGSAQGNAYLKLGDIVGESTDAKHKDWIIIESYSHGLAKSSAQGTMGATGAARRRSSAVMEDLVITKKLDKSSPKLMEFAVKGQVIPELILDITNASRNPLYKITLSNVMISSVTNSGTCSPQCEIMEQVSFNFEKITWEYTDARGGKVTASYNVETNK